MNTQEVQHINEQNFDTTISEGTTLVDFWAEWCGPCKMIAPILDEVAQEQTSNAKITKLNVDENQALAMKYNVTGIPTLIIFKNGIEINRLIGAQPKGKILSAIN